MIPHSKPNISPDDLSSVSAQLLSGNIASGKVVKQFETELGEYLGLDYGTFTDSGSKAILLALHALGVGQGDEVILPTYVCHSVIDAVIASGASPVLCDVSDNWNVSAGDVEKVMTPQTRAIILVHTMGIAIDVSLFRKFNVPIIEDCCQALGSVDASGKLTGTTGDLSVFSFHAIKCITTGEGGFVATGQAEYHNRIRSYCKIKANAGSVTDLQAALGLSQLRSYPQTLAHRKNLAVTYFQSIRNKTLTGAFESVSALSNHYRFLLQSDASFEACKAFFESQGIAIRKGVDELLHLTYPHYANGSYPNAELIFNRTISVPIHPSFNGETITQITEAINSYEHFR